MNFSNKNILIEHLLYHIPPDCVEHHVPTDNKNKTEKLEEQHEVCITSLICDNCGSKFENKILLLKHLRSSHSSLFKVQTSRYRLTKVTRRTHTQEDYEEILIHDGKKDSIEGRRKSKVCLVTNNIFLLLLLSYKISSLDQLKKYILKKYFCEKMLYSVCFVIV